ncbi:MAG: DUF6962 family protein [Ardenticatenaceae bacterium]
MKSIEFIDIPTEQTTAATDVILAVQAVGSILYLRKIEHKIAADDDERSKIRIWSAGLGLLGTSAALGAVAHGLKMSEQTRDLFWQPLSLSLGLTVSLFVVGVVYDLWGDQAARRILPVMLLIGFSFYLITRIIPGSFLIFILYEAAALLFALGAYAWLAIRKRKPGAKWMTIGILLSLIAAAIPTRKPLFVELIWKFDHNGIYHIVQMFGLLALMAGLRAGLLAEQ